LRRTAADENEGNCYKWSTESDNSACEHEYQCNKHDDKGECVHKYQCAAWDEEGKCSTEYECTAWDARGKCSKKIDDVSASYGYGESSIAIEVGGGESPW
jgi:hypothetical protein